ncbi:DUF3761 domain-containing protein [Gordonia sp. NPDC003429]
MTLGLLVGQAVDGPGIAHADTVCGSRYYQNSDGGCTPIPDDTPSGIRCKDGTYSHATHRQGACSGHGGISESTGGDDNGSGSAALGSAALGAGALGSAVLGSSILPALLFGS